MANSTKEQIYQAFTSLLDTNEFDKITVTTLVSQCNISRQTFYYHFSDIDSLVNWSITQSTKGCLAEAKKAKDLHAASTIYLEHIKQNRMFIAKCLDSSYAIKIAELITNSIIEYCTEFNRHTRISKLSGEDARFVIGFMANGTTGIIINAIHNKKDFNVEYLTDRITNMVVRKLI